MSVTIKDNEIVTDKAGSRAHEVASNSDVMVSRAMRDIKLLPDADFKNMPEVKKALQLFQQGRDQLGKAISKEFNK